MSTIFALLVPTEITRNYTEYMCMIFWGRHGDIYFNTLHSCGCKSSWCNENGWIGPWGLQPIEIIIVYAAYRLCDHVTHAYSPKTGWANRLDLNDHLLCYFCANAYKTGILNMLVSLIFSQIHRKGFNYHCLCGIQIVRSCYTCLQDPGIDMTSLPQHFKPGSRHNRYNITQRRIRQKMFIILWWPSCQMQ